MEGRQIELHVKNLDCENEAKAIRRGLEGMPGLIDLTVYAKASKVKLSYDPAATTSDAIGERLEALGFPARVGREDTEKATPWRDPKVLTSLASGVLLLAGWFAGRVDAPDALSIGLYAVAILVGGSCFGREAIEDLVFEREVGIELLMSVAALVAGALAGALSLPVVVLANEISEFVVVGSGLRMLRA
jgi:cation transport ATPase